MGHLHSGPSRVAEGCENATMAGHIEPGHMDTGVSCTACGVCMFVGFVKVGMMNMNGYGPLSECNEDYAHCSALQSRHPSSHMLYHSHDTTLTVLLHQWPVCPPSHQPSPTCLPSSPVPTPIHQFTQPPTSSVNPTCPSCAACPRPHPCACPLTAHF